MDDLPTYRKPTADLQDHPLFNGSQTVGIMSGESPRFPAQQTGHDALKQVLTASGLKHEETHGRYGLPEKSVVIYGPKREQMYQLGKQFGQEAVIHSVGGNHELMYTNGPNDGLYHPSLPEYGFHPTDEPPDDFTHLPGKGYIRLNFDFDSKLHAPLLLQKSVRQLFDIRAKAGLK